MNKDTLGIGGRSFGKNTRCARARGNTRYLFALNALQGILPFVAGHAEVLAVLRDEALGSDGLLAAMADEAGLVPAATLVLHLTGACQGSGRKEDNRDAH